MSILACIAQLRADGVIDRDRAEAFEKAFDDLKRSYSAQFGEAVADAKARMSNKISPFTNESQSRIAPPVQYVLHKGLVSLFPVVQPAPHAL